MSTLKEKRSIVFEYIQDNKLNDLHEYVTKNNINLKILNKSNFDLLLIAIDNKVSKKFVKYILQECKYQTLNYYSKYRYHSDNVYMSPLLMALVKKDYTLADLLLDNKANINYKIDNSDLFDHLFYVHKIDDTQTIKYILEKRINPPSNQIIINLIKNNQNPILELVIKHFNFSNMIIVHFLSLYKYQHSLSKEQLKKILANIINFSEDMYKQAIISENYDALKILLLHDKKNKFQTKSILFKIIIQNHLNNSLDFSKIHLLIGSFFNTEKFLDNMWNIDIKINTIRNLVLQEDINSLNQYIKENELPLSYYNNTQNDLLIYALENKISFNMIKFILSQCYYPSLNYTIGHSKNPLLEALCQSRFDVADLLIQNGADINYRVFFNDPILYYLYHRKITPNQLRYCIRHGVILSNDSFDLISKLIENSQNHLLKIIFSQSIFNREIIGILLNIYKNKVKISRHQLHDFLYKEKSKICIKKQWYKIAIQKQNYKALKILSDNDVYFFFR